MYLWWGVEASQAKESINRGVLFKLCLFSATTVISTRSFVGWNTVMIFLHDFYTRICFGFCTHLINECQRVHKLYCLSCRPLVEEKCPHPLATPRLKPNSSSWTFNLKKKNLKTNLFYFSPSSFHKKLCCTLLLYYYFLLLYFKQQFHVNHSKQRQIYILPNKDEQVSLWELLFMYL